MCVLDLSKQTKCDIEMVGLHGNVVVDHQVPFAVRVALAPQTIVPTSHLIPFGRTGMKPHRTYRCRHLPYLVLERGCTVQLHHQMIATVRGVNTCCLGEQVPDPARSCSSC